MNDQERLKQFLDLRLVWLDKWIAVANTLMVAAAGLIVTAIGFDASKDAASLSAAYGGMFKVLGGIALSASVLTYVVALQQIKESIEAYRNEVMVGDRPINLPIRLTDNGKKFFVIISVALVAFVVAFFLYMLRNLS